MNTIESVVFSSPTQEKAFFDKYGSNIFSGSRSVYDSMTDAMRYDFGAEYFLSPSGVVDLGTVRTPSSFNSDGTVRSYREVNNWKGPDTDKSFLLVANTDMAGMNESGLGFNNSTADVTTSSDRDAATPLYLDSNEVLSSGASKADIMIGYDGSEYEDIMFGHGGDDFMQAGGGLNYLIGGSGADRFVIEAVAQNTVIFGDHTSVGPNGLGTESKNESYGDTVFFDFTWPLVGPNGEKDPESYIEQLGNNRFKVYHTLDNGETIDVTLHDVEGAYFSDGAGGLEYHALTTGRPITRDDFGSLSYESGRVKFWVEHEDADFGGATTIAVVTTSTRSFRDPETNQTVRYEDPVIKWKGLASEASSFVFNDVTVNVINASQTDITGSPIVDTTIYGTSGIDLIIGDEFDNLIYGGADNDIIFGGEGKDEIYGEGGDDVLIGGDMDDILYGDFKNKVDEPDVEYNSSGSTILNPEEVSGNDVIVGGSGIDKIDSGDGKDVVASGDLSSIILNTELHQFNTFIDYDEDEIPN